jgi:hypothetical protein
MSDEQQVEGVDVTDDGDPRTGIVVSQSIPNWFRPAVILGVVITAVLAMFSLTVAVVFLAPTVDRLEGQLAQARDDRAVSEAALAAELAAVKEAQRIEKQIDDCVALYYDDIEIAKGIAQLALNEAVARAQDPDADRAELSASIVAADKPLADALRALEEYRIITPPPDECPHPRSD